MAASLFRGTDTEAGVAKFVLDSGVAAAGSAADAEEVVAEAAESLTVFAGPVSGPSTAGYSTIACCTVPGTGAG